MCPANQHIYFIDIKSFTIGDSSSKKLGVKPIFSDNFAIASLINVPNPSFGIVLTIFDLS